MRSVIAWRRQFLCVIRTTVARHKQKIAMQPAIISVLVLKFADQVTNHTRFRYLPSTGQWSLVERTASIRANTIVPTYVVNVTAKSATVQRPSVGSGMRRSLEHPSLHLPAHFTSRLASHKSYQPPIVSRIKFRSGPVSKAFMNSRGARVYANKKICFDPATLACLKVCTPLVEAWPVGFNVLFLFS